MNELKGSKVYIILSIKEGEGFGFLQESSIISCSLNGHTLQTDPCGVRSAPIFDSELIWETDKKTFRSLRLQNIPIKVHVAGVTGKKIGYFLLSLLSATPCPSNKSCVISHSWYKLLGLNVEAKSSEPKLLLRLIISDSETSNKNIDQIKTPRSVLSVPSKNITKTPIYVRSTSNIATVVESGTVPKLSLSDENIAASVKRDNEHSGIMENSREVKDIVEEINKQIESDKSDKNDEGSHKHVNLEMNPSKVHNVTFQSHNTSIRYDDVKSDVNIEKEIKPNTISDVSTVLSEAYSEKDSLLEDKMYISDNDNVLHAQGDTPQYRHNIKRSHLLSPQSKEELIRKTVKALEKWKEKQQLLYSEKLKQSEKLLLLRLEKEWRSREVEQERIVKECKRFSQTLQQALKEINERSNDLALKENKLRLARDELEMLYMSKYHELNEAARRMEDDYNYKTKLQDIALSQLENKVKYLEENNISYKDKLRFAEDELDKLKRNVSSNGEINNLKHEKTCLERQLEAALKSKAFFKDQWVSAVREANILKLKYSTNITLPQSDSTANRFEELLQNEASLLQFDNISLRKLKDDIIISERSDSHDATAYRRDIRDRSLSIDIGTPSKKSVSYKSDRSFVK